MTDPRDIVQPVPSAFAGSVIVSAEDGGNHPYNPVAEGIGFSRIYWIYGDAPKTSGCVSEVKDPPCSGWSSVFVLHETEKDVRIYCPYSMRSWKISRRSYEFQSLAGHFPEIPVERHKERFVSKWKEYAKRGEQVDFFVAEEIMEALGVAIPTEAEIDQFKIPTKKAPVQQDAKPKAAASLTKPVKREGRRGEVLQFFLDCDGYSGSIATAMSKFSITRSNLLSQLFLLRKNHGIEYTVNGDTAVIQLPEGCDDPFE